MVKSYLFSFMTIFVTIIGECQSNEKHKLESIQGIWEGTANSESQNLYKVIEGNKSLGISFSDTSSSSGFYLNESIEGFQNYKYGEVDSINVKSLREDGKFYTSIVDQEQIDKDGWVYIAYCIIPDYFECDGELMSINGGQLTEFGKINQLPFKALRKLYERGKIDKRDYIKDYVGLTVFVIKKLKCVIYYQPNKRSNARLNKDDLVITVEDRGKWLIVQYNDTKIGWIRKEDVQ